jgi:hypothetical protein
VGDNRHEAHARMGRRTVRVFVRNPLMNLLEDAK